MWHTYRHTGPALSFRPCWCPHQHAHSGHATQSLSQFIARNEAISRSECLHAAPRKKAPRTEPRSAPCLRAHLPPVLVSSPTRSRSTPSRRSSRGTKRSHGMSAFTRAPRKKHLAQSRSPLPSSALTFRPCWCPHQHARAERTPAGHREERSDLTE